jgi:hypothetical protein
VTRQDVLNVNLTRVGAIVGILGGLAVLVATVTAFWDHRYAQRDDVAAIRADIRVLRCQVVKDCKAP